MASTERPKVGEFVLNSWALVLGDATLLVAEAGAFREDESILLTDSTWISFPRLLTWHRRSRDGSKLCLQSPEPVMPWLFASEAEALGVRATWPASMPIKAVRVR